jgi:hypothetical protein
LCLQRNFWKRLKLEFAYDAQHRRVMKRVKEWKGDTATGGFTNVVKDRRYVYDGWNVIAESSRGTEARWTDGAAGCPAGVRARAECPNQNRLVGMQEQMISVAVGLGPDDGSEAVET